MTLKKCALFAINFNAMQRVPKISRAAKGGNRKMTAYVYLQLLGFIRAPAFADFLEIAFPANAPQFLKRASLPVYPDKFS
ncbi:hypothetical protein ABVB72_24445 [Rhizobium nepotum]|uniref:hypothetical protein n=1 Tax=Rhizobium nepotum TaxID=1035271 RepID=UPI00336A7030